jgi:hypothetical protein
MSTEMSSGPIITPDWGKIRARVSVTTFVADLTLLSYDQLAYKTNTQANGRQQSHQTDSAHVTFAEKHKENISSGGETPTAFGPATRNATR